MKIGDTIKHAQYAKYYGVEILLSNGFSYKIQSGMMYDDFGVIEINKIDEMKINNRASILPTETIANINIREDGIFIIFESGSFYSIECEVKYEYGESSPETIVKKIKNIDKEYENKFGLITNEVYNLSIEEEKIKREIKKMYELMNKYTNEALGYIKTVLGEDVK